MAVEQLRTLAKNSQRRSKTGQLRELYEEIERTQKAGVKNVNIVDVLNDMGIEITHGTFVTLLHRIRKQNSLDSSHNSSNDNARGQETTKHEPETNKYIKPRNRGGITGNNQKNESQFPATPITPPKDLAPGQNIFSAVVQQMQEIESNKDPRRNK